MPRLQRCKGLWLAAVALGFFSLPGAAQEVGFAGDFGLAAVFVPAPFTFSTLRLDADLTLTLLDARFSSQTRLTLAQLLRQQFALAVSVGALAVENELRFGPELAFQRNRLQAALRFPAVELHSALLVTNIGSVQTPEVAMGVVLGADWVSLAPVTVFGQMGFGVRALTEDLDLDEDGEPDLIVQTPFAFAEGVAGIALAAAPWKLEFKALFGAPGFLRLVLASGFALDAPRVSMGVRLALGWPPALERLELDVRAALGPLQAHSLTAVEATGELALLQQRFTLEVEVLDGVRLVWQGAFDRFGLIEIRLGAGWRF